MLCLPSTVTFPQSVRIKENLKIIYFNFVILLFQFISTIAIFRWENQDPEWSNNLPTISEWGMWHFDATKHFLLSKNLSRNRYLPISDPHLPLYSNIFVDKDADWRGVIHILLGNIFQYFCILMPNTHAKILCFALIITDWIRKNLIIKVCCSHFCLLVTPPLHSMFKCYPLSVVLLRAGLFEEYSCFLSCLNGQTSQLASQGQPALVFTTPGPSIEKSNTDLGSTHWLADIKN